MPLFDLPPKLWLPPKPAIIRAWKREELKRQPLVQASFLPGMFPAGAAAAAPPATTLTQVGSGTDGDDDGSITSSVTIQAGDLLVVWGRGNEVVATAAFPPGFTSAVTAQDDGTRKAGLFYKIADGSEGTSVTGFSSTGAGASADNTLYVFRGDNPITEVTVGDPGSQVTTGNPTAQTITAASGTPPLVVLGGYLSDDGTVNPRTFTVGGSAAKDGEVNATTGEDLWLAYKLYNTSPADVVVDADDDGTTMILSSCYLACS